jgi:FAD/FMN-containing dehydrogenase
MDNALSYDVVLGNGSQVRACKESSPDLFWALKGGGSNYGIVTNFELKTYPAPKVSSTYQIFDEAYVQDFIAAACDMAEWDDGAVGAGAVINMSYNTTTKKVTPQVFGLQEGVSSPPSRFANFTAIPAVQRMHNVTEPATWHSQFETPNQMFRYEASPFLHCTI